ncbi:MAG: D-alanyl-D-alanine carboxypeptidase [Clostridia bacterium]|nr:D-alanyl-D-alanine carboxypeptidase [Clostridia bacterium]MBQ4157532.1 D-alanyl-D-alanine carboxypeptidase [Clostridia bacterium]
MKRMILIAMAAIVLITGGEAEEVLSSARGMIVIEASSGRELYFKNPDERLPIASTTKIMTCLLALENASLSDQVTAGENASGVEGTSIYLSVGETLTMEEMLYGLMLRSGNDAAVAIAEHVSGDQESFSYLMNKRAEELNADAYFTTPNGLDKGGNGASARGLVRIAQEAMKNEEFRRIVSTGKKTIPWVDHDYKRVLTNKNRLLTSYEGAVGVKTGFTGKAGRCLVFAAERDGMMLLGVVLNCSDWFSEAERLMNDAFSEYKMHTFYEKGEVIISSDVPGSGGSKCEIAAEQPLMYPLKEGETAETEFELFALNAPVEKGSEAGRAHLLVNGERVTSIGLISGNDVNAYGFRNAFEDVLGYWLIG